MNTDRQTIEATELDVCVAGSLCALHLHTRVGTIVARVPLSAFIRKARAERDGNGRAFPSAAPGDVPAPPSGRGRDLAHLPPERVAAYHRARAMFEGGKSRRLSAAENGLNENTFAGWLVKQRAKERRAAA